MGLRKLFALAVLLVGFSLLGLSVQAAKPQTDQSEALQADRWCRGRLVASAWGEGGSGGRDVWAWYSIPAGKEEQVRWIFPVTGKPHYQPVGYESPGNRDIYAILVGGSALDKRFIRSAGRVAIARLAWIVYRC